jgi:hypothetical protein
LDFFGETGPWFIFLGVLCFAGDGLSRG